MILFNSRGEILVIRKERRFRAIRDFERVGRFSYGGIIEECTGTLDNAEWSEP